MNARAPRLVRLMAAALVAGALPLQLAAPGAAAGGSVTLTLAQRSLPSDGSSTTTARAAVRDASGQPVPNQAVRFSTDGDVTFSPPVATTGTDGTASSTVTASTTAGAETLTAATVAGDVAGGASAILLEGPGWSLTRPSSAPPGRFEASMAYDVATSSTVLFGGRTDVVTFSGSPYDSDTWTWDGATWTPRVPPVSPPQRWGASMAYDAANGTVVLFGGTSAIQEVAVSSVPVGPSQSLANDTWTWDGSTWTQHRQPTGSGPPPSPRQNAAMAYDPFSRRLVLFGGEGGDGFVGDTWMWDGTAWTQATPATSPIPRTQAMMATDPESGSVILVGGQAVDPVTGVTSVPGDTWLWSGSSQSWTQQAPATPPPARFRAVMAGDDATRSVVLFGGQDAAGNPLADTWTWTGTNWAPQPLGTQPGGAIDAAIAYDSANQTIVLLRDGTAQSGSDTWTYLDASSTSVSLSRSPIRAGSNETTTATASVIGVDGTASTPAGGESIAFRRGPSGDIAFGPANPGPGGTYTATITASSTPEVEAITAVPTIATRSGSATLVETGYGAALTPAALSFSGQAVGVASAPRTVTLTNTSLSTMAVTGITAGGDFAETNGCSSGLASAASCTIAVTFTPTAAGARAGALSVQNSVTSAPLTATLTGTGIPPVTGDASAVFLQGVTLVPGASPVRLRDGGQGICEAGPVRTAAAATVTGSGGTGCRASLAANTPPAILVEVFTESARTSTGQAMATNLNTESVSTGGGTASADSRVASASVLPGMGPTGADVLDVDGLDAHTSASCSGSASGTPASSSSIGSLSINGTRVATQPVGSRIIFNPTGKNPITLYGNPITVNPTGARVPMAIVTLNYSRYDPATNTQVSSPLEVEFPAGGALSSVIVGRVFISYAAAGAPGCR